MKLKDKVAIVSGGSRGVGKTVAQFFCREGARVFILARKKDELAAAVRDIGRVTGMKPFGFVCDVGDDASVLRAVRAVQKKCRRVDVLVNAAGIQEPIGVFAENSAKAWEENININLLGTVRLCRAVVRTMMKNKAGVIINFSGGGATSSRPHFSAYAVAKTGIVKFTEILADELSPYRIRVNAIAPGAVNTAMLTEVLKAGKRAGSVELASARKRKKEGGVSPELAADLAVFLASDDSEGLSGRLVSAPWDAWRSWNKKKIKEIMAGEALKLRRAQ